jgi:hypothetical protein
MVYSVHFMFAIRYFLVTDYKTINGNFPEKQTSAAAASACNILARKANVCHYKSLQVEIPAEFCGGQKAG